MPYIRTLLRIGIIAILAFGVASGSFRFTHSAPVDTPFESAVETVVEPEPPEETEPHEEVAAVAESEPDALKYGYDAVQTITPDFYDDIAEKQQQNPDSIGWLHIPDTTIDEVILKNPEAETNDYYLNLSFDKQPDADGVFCADHRAQFGDGGRENLSGVTALYGHSRDDDPDGALFSQLKKYRDEQFAAEHPYIFFSTEAEDMVWEVFAVFDTTVYVPYIEPDLTQSEFEQMLNTVYALSIYDYYPEISYEDKLLTLSTCTFTVPGHESLPELNNYRFAIMARLVEPDEEIREYAEFTVKKRIMEPDSTLPFSY